ncbi:unnamed protein product [Acanthoscelides obtectus]|uniref:Uncharacterized protein n=1 Tax=Acanthoscelides obtectus TaxID=200917 RepID=A0A9P0L4C8_ACAOB|nr:unnamed protein product [Acanthoscelides obtectus]CAK1649621.1 hypothetical protein AOBTE_LOCUS16334 [Acanthoscelides obtectus]
MYHSTADSRGRFVPSQQSTRLHLFSIDARWRAIPRAASDKFKGIGSGFVVVFVVSPELEDYYRRTHFFPRRQRGLSMCKMHIHERLSLKQLCQKRCA